MAELGWLGVSVPEAYGGAGGGMVDACLFLEESARGMAPIGAYGTTLIVAGAYERFGSEEQKAAMLGGIARGAIEAIAMTEPGAGSDVGRAAVPGHAPRTATTCSRGRRRASRTPTCPPTCWSSPAPTRAAASTTG